MTEFIPFPKVPRLSREMVITEKLDGTNASVVIVDCTTGFDFFFDVRLVVAEVGDFSIFAGSRKRFVVPNSDGEQTDNFGFAAWVRDNADELMKLGPGTHYGEWWGKGIQRGYGLDERRFSLFNTGRWSYHYGEFHPEALLADGTTVAPECCHVVPVLYRGRFSSDMIDWTLGNLKRAGSLAALAYMNPEGIMIYHTAAHQYFKKTLEGDDARKGA